MKRFIFASIFISLALAISAQKGVYPPEYLAVDTTVVEFTVVDNDTIKSLSGYKSSVTTASKNLSRYKIVILQITTEKNTSEDLYVNLHTFDENNKFTPLVRNGGYLTLSSGDSSRTFTTANDGLFSGIDLPFTSDLFFSIENGRPGVPAYPASEGRNTLKIKIWLVRAEATQPTFAERIKALPGIVSYWPLTDSSGTTAVNEISTLLNGTYVGSIPLRATAFPTGNAGVDLNDSNDEITVPIAAINDVWDWSNGWLMLWFKTDTAQVYNNGVENIAFQAASSDSYFFVTKSDIGEYGRHVARWQGDQPGNSEIQFSKRHENWNMVVFSWTTDTMLIYLDGQLVRKSSRGPSLDTLTSFSIGKITGWRGGFAHVAFGAGINLVPWQIEQIWQTAYRSSLSIFGCGDSKAADDNDRWIPLLAGEITSITGTSWREAPYRIGLPGAKTDEALNYLNQFLADLEYEPTFIFVSCGANDLGQIYEGTLDSAEWVTRMRNYIDALHTKWPRAKVFWIKPYRDDFSDGRYDTFALDMARWIDFVVSIPEYTGIVYAGIDENIWFKPNITTYSSDRVHYNNAGHLKAIELWMEILADFL